MITFAVLFVGISGARLARYSACDKKRRAAAWLQQTAQRISEKWFSFFVGNAFGAFVSAMVLLWVQQFSLTQMLFHWIMGQLQPLIQSSAHFFLGTSRTDVIQGLLAWYSDNQLKFTFWFLYIAALCDDLGLPNFKTLGGLMWRWMCARGRKS